MNCTNDSASTEPVFIFSVVENELIINDNVTFVSSTNRKPETAPLPLNKKSAKHSYP